MKYMDSVNGQKEHLIWMKKQKEKFSKNSKGKGMEENGGTVSSD